MQKRFQKHYKSPENRITHTWAMYKYFEISKRLVKLVKEVVCKQRVSLYSHYENTPIQIYWKLYHQKNDNFLIKNSDIFHISTQNIDCGYSAVLTSTRNLCFWAEIQKNNVYPCKPQFYNIKVGFKGVKII